jgi:hypothetical protein
MERMVQCTPAPGGASFNDCCPSCRITSPHVRFVFIACDGQETGLVLFALNPISGLGGHCEHTAVHRCLCVSAPVPAPHCSYIPVAIKKLKVPVGDLDPDATADFSNEVGFGVGVYPLDSDHQRPRYDGKSMLCQFFFILFLSHGTRSHVCFFFHRCHSCDPSGTSICCPFTVQSQTRTILRTW